MNRRGFVIAIGSLVVYREFVRENETVYLGSTLRVSDYSNVSIKNCKIRQAAWFPKGEAMIHIDAPCEIMNNEIYPE